MGEPPAVNLGWLAAVGELREAAAPNARGPPPRQARAVGRRQTDSGERDMDTNHHDKGLQREPPHGAADDFTAAQLLCLPVYVDPSAGKSKRRWVLFALVVVICLLLACGWAGDWICLFGPFADVAGDEAALKRKIAEELPLGSTKEQVESWLKEQGISHEGDIHDISGGEPVGFGAYMPYHKGCLDGGVRMEFDFDRDSKLTKVYMDIFIPSL
jgi:hypothetical protein